MSPLAGSVMVAATGLCFAGALAGRRPIAVIAAAIMLAAMADLAFLGWIAPVWWVALLTFGGMLLGLELRNRRRDESYAYLAGKDDGVQLRSPPRDALHRTVMIAAALAYPAAAGLGLVHDHGDPGSRLLEGISAAASHRHPGSDLWMLSANVLVGILAIVLAALMATALYRGRALLAAESGGMAVMLVMMMTPQLFTA